MAIMKLSTRLGFEPVIYDAITRDENFLVERQELCELEHAAMQTVQELFMYGNAFRSCDEPGYGTIIL
jgi:hypothetical protein